MADAALVPAAWDIPDAAVVALAAFCCVAGYRVRGSRLWREWTGRGVTTARIVAWGGSCAVAVLLCWPVPWWLPPGVMLAAWAGATPPQWGSIDIGHREGTWWRDLLVQSGRGLIGVSGIAALLALAGGAWWPVAGAGVLAGPVYALAWSLGLDARHPELDEPPEWAELLWGAGIALGPPG